MECDKAEKYLVEYLYRELSASKTVEVEKHIEGCPRCAKTLETWRVIHAGYQGIKESPAPSPFMKQRIVAAAKEELQKKPSVLERLFGVLRPAFVVPIVLVALLALWQFTAVTKKSSTQMAQAPQVIAAKEKPAAVSSRDVQPERQEAAKVAPQEKLSTIQQDELRNLGYVADEDGKDLEQERGGFQEESKRIYSAPAPEPASEPQPSSPGKEQPTVAGEAPAYEADAGKQKKAETAAPASPAGRKDSSNVEYNYLNSQQKFQNNELQSGLSFAKQAIQEDDSGSLASRYHNSGIQYQQNKQFDAAIVQFNLVLENYPEYPQADDVMARLADSYTEIGDLEDARQTYEKLLRKSRSKSAVQQKIQDLQKKEDARRQLDALEKSEAEKD